MILDISNVNFCHDLNKEKFYLFKFIIQVLQMGL